MKLKHFGQNLTILLKVVSKNKLLFPEIICGGQGSKVELFWGGFNFFTKKLFPRINNYSRK